MKKKLALALAFTLGVCMPNFGTTVTADDNNQVEVNSKGSFEYQDLLIDSNDIVQLADVSNTQQNILDGHEVTLQNQGETIQKQGEKLQIVSDDLDVTKMDVNITQGELNGTVTGTSVIDDLKKDDEQLQLQFDNLINRNLMSGYCYNNTLYLSPVTINEEITTGDGTNEQN